MRLQFIGGDMLQALKPGKAPLIAETMAGAECCKRFGQNRPAEAVQRNAMQAKHWQPAVAAA